MPTDRYVIVGVATARAEWFRATSQWANSSALPIEFLRCISTGEARTRLSSGRPHSALVIDERISGLDRDLIETAKDNGCAVLIITAPGSGRDWLELGADDVIDTSQFDRSWLLDALERKADPITDVTMDTALEVQPATDTSWSGQMVAVTGAGGTGASTIAMALAQGIGSDARQHSLVCLADLKLNAELALLHDARDVVPGIQELIDLYRTSTPSRSQVQQACYHVEQRHYDLLLGLRNHRDWTLLRRRSAEVTISGLARSFQHLIVDVDLDIEGEADTGSIDIEDRNTLARVALDRAEVVVIVGEGSMKGLFALTRSTNQLVEFGVEPASIVAVINHAPKRVRLRAELIASFSDLLAPEIADSISSPILVPHRRKVVDAVRDVAPLPQSIVKPVTAEVLARLESRASATRFEPDVDYGPVPVAPGSLGMFYESPEGAQ